MPLFRRLELVKAPPLVNVKPKTPVFVIRFTGESFLDYSSYIQRLDVYRERIWTCRLTGRTNLTYEEAEASENAGLGKAEGMPAALRETAIRAIHHKTESLEVLLEHLHKLFEPKHGVGSRLVVQLNPVQKAAGVVVNIFPAKNLHDHMGTGGPFVKVFQDPIDPETEVFDVLISPDTAKSEPDAAAAQAGQAGADGGAPQVKTEGEEENDAKDVEMKDIEVKNDVEMKEENREGKKDTDKLDADTANPAEAARAPEKPMHLYATERQLPKQVHPCPKTVLKLFIRQNFTKDTYPGAPWVALPTLIHQYRLERELPADAQASKDKYDSRRKRPASALAAIPAAQVAAAAAADVPSAPATGATPSSGAAGAGLVGTANVTGGLSGGADMCTLEQIQRELAKLRESPAEREKRMQREAKERERRAAEAKNREKENREQVERKPAVVKPEPPPAAVEDLELAPDPTKPASPPSLTFERIEVEDGLADRALGHWDFLQRFGEVVRLAPFSWDDFRRSLQHMLHGSNAIFDASVFACLSTAWPAAQSYYTRTDASPTRALCRFLSEVIVKPFEARQRKEAEAAAALEKQQLRIAEQRAKRQAELAKAGENEGAPAGGEPEGDVADGSDDDEAEAIEDAEDPNEVKMDVAEASSAILLLGMLSGRGDSVGSLAPRDKLALLDLLVHRALESEVIRKHLEHSERVVQEAKNLAREWHADARRRERKERSKAWWANKSKGKGGSAPDASMPDDEAMGERSDGDSVSEDEDQPAGPKVKKAKVSKEKKALPKECPDVRATEIKFSQRTEPLGTDRNHRAFYQFMGCKYLLFVRLPPAADEPVASSKPPMACGAGAGVGSGDAPAEGGVRWGCYDQPEQIEQLLHYLDSRGLREKALKEALAPLVEDLQKSMRKNHQDLLNQIMAAENSGRRNTTRRAAADGKGWIEPYQRYTNSLRPPPK